MMPVWGGIEGAFKAASEMADKIVGPPDRVWLIVNGCVGIAAVPVFLSIKMEYNNWRQTGSGLMLGAHVGFAVLMAAFLLALNFVMMEVSPKLQQKRQNRDTFDKTFPPRERLGSESLDLRKRMTRKKSI
eukprot:GHVO01056820.1.p1 GENE.GHVO01056820.1~~GHVO01056820.1.p1  ORF type:complete len:130 (+),score=24.30 GHVO01056820.1:262-651(+)